MWLSLAPERFPLQANTFRHAAGTAGKQKWSLILPSSARVSELTYVTIIGTRYPELDNSQNEIIQFGNYLQAEQCTRGGFLPIFFHAPFSYLHASTDIGEVVDWIKGKFVVATKGDLAVLHNRNKMLNAFSTTEWVSGSGGTIISRSVTSCAFFFPALPDECVTLSVNSGMRMKMRSKFPRQRTRKHNKKTNQHHKPNPKTNPSAKPVVPREMQTR